MQKNVKQVMHIIYGLLRTGIEQELDRVIQRVPELFLLFLLKLLQPQNGMHSLPHDPIIFGQLLNSVDLWILLVQSIHLCLLWVLQIRASCTRLTNLLQQHRHVPHPLAPSINICLALSVLQFKFCQFTI